MRFSTGWPKALALAAIAALVLTVSVGAPPAHGLGSFTSQGVQAHLSAPWNQAGYSGQGIKVGIIDIGSGEGFQGYRSLMGTELPATVEARCYTGADRYTSDVATCDSGSDHGTLVAESVADIAPEVSFYIANPGTKADFGAVVDWMIAEGVSVINYSGSWTFDGPGDGTSPFSYSPLKAVDRAVDAGIVWVNAAGNHARRTWFTRAPMDADDDRWLEFSGPYEVSTVSLEAGDTFFRPAAVAGGMGPAGN